MVEDLAACAGCGRTAAQAGELLSGENLATPLRVCRSCIGECVDTIASGPTRIPGALRPCSFCSKPEDQVAFMLALGTRMICDRCVDQYSAGIPAAR